MGPQKLRIRPWRLWVSKNNILWNIIWKRGFNLWFQYERSLLLSYCNIRSDINIGKGRKFYLQEESLLTIATEQVASIFGNKKYLVAEVWRYYLNGKPLFVVNPKENYCLESTRVPRACSVANMSHHFFWELQQIRQRAVEKYVMDFLVWCGFIAVNWDNNRDVKYVLSSDTFWPWRILWRTVMMTMMMILTKTAALCHNQ